MLQFLSRPEELEVNERILTPILCKPDVFRGSTRTPYSHPTSSEFLLRTVGTVVAAAVRDVTPDSLVAILQTMKQLLLELKQ
jgi:hypothetical protein